MISAKLYRTTTKKIVKTEISLATATECRLPGHKDNRAWCLT